MLVNLKLAMVFAVPVAGHSFLQKPSARNMVAFKGGKEYCPHCLQGGGPDTVRGRGEGIWPTKDDYGSHGLCGDPVQGKQPPTDWKQETYLKAGPIQMTYTAGSVVEFEIGVSTHHEGHYEFRICDKALDAATLTSVEEGQKCLDQWVLRRAPPRSDCVVNDPDADCQPLDEDYPERWYLPPQLYGTQKAGDGWDDGMASSHPAVTEVHKMRYVIPANLTCTHCTLQWYWASGNSCLYDEGYLKYFSKMRDLKWNSERWCRYCTTGATCAQRCCKTGGKFGEEFWNCADIAVIAGDGAPLPTPTPTLSPTTTAAPGECSKEWDQCGGTEWNGRTCCETGTYCHFHGPCYSQCTPTSISPMPSTCQGICNLTDVTAKGKKCSDYSGSVESCRNCYMSSGNTIVPCSWSECGGCIANGEDMLSCSNLPALCRHDIAYLIEK